MDGQSVGLIVLGAFPNTLGFLQMAFSQDKAIVIPQLRLQAAIAPIVDHPRFPQFYDDFRDYIISGLPVPEDFAAADGTVTAAEINSLLS